MSKVFIYPNFKYDCAKAIDNNIFYRYYLGEIVFTLPEISEEKQISDIQLVMRCVKMCNCVEMEVYIEDDSNLVTIYHPGIFRWNLTGLNIKAADSNQITLTVYTSDICCKCNDYNIDNLFTTPLIEAAIEDKFYKDYSKSQIYKEYLFSNEKLLTDWIPCTDLYDGIFYIKNTGNITIKATYDYGPTMTDYISDGFEYVIEPQKMVTISLLRNANYVRVILNNTSCLDSYNNNLLGSRRRINKSSYSLANNEAKAKVWFLGTSR